MEPSLFPVEEGTDSAPHLSSGDSGSLYRAYRSLTFAEVAGQSHVTQTLRNAVRYGKVAHAYLFTGPRGTGKTSTARILARAVNCLHPQDGEPCNACAICLSMLERRSLDLVEIDGASNNSVDDVRELRERVNFRPAEARKKVFIIDEVHMLSIGAFNALLKTLEEPPEHVLFALATTEVHKVPATVVSRCQRLDLRPIPPPEMIERLRFVCHRERIEAEPAVLAFLAAQSTGSLRDALSLLEQIRAYCGDVLYLQEVEAALGVARASHVADLADIMAAGDLAGALSLVGDLADAGVDPRQLARQLSGYWRDALLARARQQPVPEPHVAACQSAQILPVLRSLLTVESATRRSDSPRWALELAIAEATLNLGGMLAGPGRKPALEATPAVSPASQPGVPAASGSGAGGRSGMGRDPGSPTASRPGVRDEGPAPVRQDGHAAGSNPVELNQAMAGEKRGSFSVATPVPVPGAGPAQDAGQPEETNPVPPVFRGPGSAETKPSGHAAAGTNPPAGHTDQPEQGNHRQSEPSGTAAATITADQVRERWPRILGNVGRRSVHSTLLNAVLDSLQVENDLLIVGVRTEFERERLVQPENTRLVEAAIDAVLGGRWRVQYVTIDPDLAPDANNQPMEYLDRIAAKASARGRGQDGNT